MSNLPASDKPAVKKKTVGTVNASAPKKTTAAKKTASSAAAKPVAKKSSSSAAAKPAVKKAASSSAKKPSAAAKKRPQSKQLTAREQMLSLWERIVRSVKPVLDLIPEKWRRAVYLTLLDILMIGIGLLIFAYFHHVRQVSYSGEDFITIKRPNGTAAVTPTDSDNLLSLWENNPYTGVLPSNHSETTPTPDTGTPLPAVTPTPSPAPTADPNDWGAKFADQFTSGNVEWTDTSYRSGNISISIERFSAMDEGDDPQVWFVADIYIRDIENLRTALAQGTYGKGYKDWAAFMAYDNGGILAISGDYYGAREKGVVIRNGTVYRKDTFKDVCIIYYDGTMETMSAKEFDIDRAISRGAYQAFSFGPALLDENGKVKTKYDSEITDPNPRCAIGYFEPGHYCFVLADGRQPDYSEGLRMHELAQIFEDMGCKAAYNLDGGATASMIFNNKIVNQPYDGGRKVSDIILIGEAAQ